MKLLINPDCFTLEVLEQLSLYHIPKWERNKTNTNLFKSITNNIAPFISITWHQKESLGCVVYSHCPTNDSYNISAVYMAPGYLVIMLQAFWHIAEGY